MSARTAERRIPANPPLVRLAHFIRHRCFWACLLSLILPFPVLAVAQPVASTPAALQPEPAREPLGRSTPRGTVLGFLSAAHKGNYEIAAQYLDTRLRDKSAAILAHQLFVVLDRRLPARLNQLSDKPEGSLPNPLRPDQDLVGTITSVNGNVDVLLDRVDIGKGELRWLFAATTLESIPRLYDEVNVLSVDNILPQAMVNNRLAGIPLFEWLAVLVGMPLLYAITVLVSRLASPLAGELRRHLRKRPELPNPDLVPRPLRLLLVAFLILWTISKVSLPLLARQFWSSTATIIYYCGLRLAFYFAERLGRGACSSTLGPPPHWSRFDPASRATGNRSPRRLRGHACRPPPFWCEPNGCTGRTGGRRHRCRACCSKDTGERDRRCFHHLRPPHS